MIILNFFVSNYRCVSSILVTVALFCSSNSVMFPVICDPCDFVFRICIFEEAPLQTVLQ